MTEINGFIDRVSPDRLSLSGWVTYPGPDLPQLSVECEGRILGIVVFGSERNDVRIATGRRNLAFSIKLDRQVNPIEILGRGVRVLLELDGNQHPLHLSSAARVSERRLALSDLSQALGGTSDGPEELGGHSLYYSSELDEAGKTGNLSPIYFPIGYRSRDGSAVLGKEGHLFLVRGSNDLIQQYEEPQNHEEKIRLNTLVKEWISLINSRQTKISGIGSHFIQMVIPEKLTSMRHFSPLPINGPTPLLRSLDAELRDHQSWVKAIQVFEDWESPIDPWQHNDSHNSSAGSLAIVRELLKAMSLPDLKQLQDVKFDQIRYYDGDLSQRFFNIPLWDEHRDPEPDFFRKESESIEKIFEHVPNKGHIGVHKVWKNHAAPLDKKVVVFGNSFFGQSADTPAKLSWWFSRIFSEFHFIWSPEVDYAYINEISADFVLAQTIERFLGRVPAI